MTVIDACGRAHVPTLLSSDPGVGKSSLVRGIAASEGVICETVLGSLREPADVRGIPVVTAEGVVLAPRPMPSGWPRPGLATCSWTS